jgi:hypothetical protein
MSAPVLEHPKCPEPPLEGGELVGVGAPKRPSPNQGDAAAVPPSPKRREQPSRTKPRVPR